MKTNFDQHRVLNHADTVRSNYESHLKRFVDIPSVSMDPAHKNDINDMAEAALDLFKEFGANAEIMKTNGNPVIYGEFLTSNNHPTVLIYNHLDVQPADGSEWKHPPFNMKVVGDSYLGRGTTDDKGPALSVLYGARYAYENNIPINIKFLWELEEEIGSPSFEAFLKGSAKRLKTDSIVVSDTIWVSRTRPAIPYGLRGLQAISIHLKTGIKDVHSGTTGGLARNPLGELCKVISACYEADSGQVKIPGFYDDVEEPTEDEIEHFLESGFSLSHFKQAHELTSLRTTDLREGALRIWAHPTFEVHGITGGYTGPGVKTIVPHQAEAKISMRLVPNQDPQKIVRLVTDFVKKQCPTAEIQEEGTLKPFLGNWSNPYNQAAARSMQAVFGVKPAFTREGGSIGAVLTFHNILKVPIVFLGLSLPEHGYHAIDENFDWPQARGGIGLFAEYFQELTTIKDYSN